MFPVAGVPVNVIILVPRTPPNKNLPPLYSLSSSVESFAYVSCLGGIFIFGTGSVNTNALVTCDGNRIQQFSGSITANAIVTANAYRILSFSSSITTSATVNATSFVTWSKIVINLSRFDKLLGEVNSSTTRISVISGTAAFDCRS